MNAPDQTLCLSQLAMAATQAKLGESHCQEAAARGAIIGLTEIPKIRLAQIHFQQAEKFLTAALQNLGSSASLPSLPSVQPDPVTLSPAAAANIASSDTPPITGANEKPASGDFISAPVQPLPLNLQSSIVNRQ